MKGHKFNEKGQSVVIMALALAVLMGIMAVAIDGGRIYTLRRDAQNAADAAALQAAAALCRDEDFMATAYKVAKMGGFSGAGTVAVNKPPLHSDSPTFSEDQIEVVITATIHGGLIAPVVYGGELNTRVLAVGDCLRGSLSGSGSAIFAGAQNCDTNEVDLNGASIQIIGGVHSNDDIHISGGGQEITITGTVSYVGDTEIDSSAVLYPSSGNPAPVSPKDYPIDLAFEDFMPDGWAYNAIFAKDPSAYHYFPPVGGHVVDGNDLENGGLLVDGELAPGVYVTRNGFKFSRNGLVGNGVTFVSKGPIDFSGDFTMLRPYFSGLLLFSEAFGNICGSNAAIKMSGATVSWGGIIFAPNGNVNMSFSANSTYYGSIIAGTVDVSGSDTMIIYDPSYLPPDPDTIELGQ